MIEVVSTTTLDLPLLSWVILGLLTIWFIKTRNSVPQGIPPFPVRPFPVLGHIPMLGKTTLETMKQWQITTGDIYSIYMGPKLAVVINSYQILKEAFVKHADSFSDRAHRFVNKDDRFDGGIADTNGPLWKEQRTVAISILRKFGMGKNWMGEKINIEVKEYLDTLTKTKGEPTNARHLTDACVSNIICTILTGERFDLDDPYFQKFFKILSQQVIYLQGTSILKVFPWLQYLPGDLFHAKAMLKNEEVFLSEFSLKYINKIRNNMDKDSEQNFIKSYLMEEKARRESGQETTLDEKNLSMVITNLFQAGTETTSITIMWAFLHAIHNPDMQKKLHQEIDEVVGSERFLSFEDKAKLKYVNAFIMETQRLFYIAPLILPHECSKTTTIAGYIIPKGTLIMPNFSTMFLDSKTWKDPNVFRPERFLDDQGNLVVPEYFIPFSIGRRICPGDALAKLELFFFITSTLQRFNLQPEDPDNLPPLEQVFGLTCPPKPYKIRFIPRQ